MYGTPTTQDLIDLINGFEKENLLAQLAEDNTVVARFEQAEQKEASVHWTSGWPKN